MREKRSRELEAWLLSVFAQALFRRSEVLRDFLTDTSYALDFAPLKVENPSSKEDAVHPARVFRKALKAQEIDIVEFTLSLLERMGLSLSERSLKILAIEPGGQADRCAIKVGWKVMFVDGERVKSEKQLMERLTALHAEVASTVSSRLSAHALTSFLSRDLSLRFF
jgi:predicted metalloprotease with PDZ domain